MTEKELLDHRKMYRQVRALSLIVRELEHTIGYTPVQFDCQTAHGGAAETSQVERFADRLMQAKQRYANSLDQWEQEQRRIEAELSMLPKDEEQVLTAYYCSLDTWSQVAETLGYSERQVFRLRKQGLERLEKENNDRAINIQS